MSAALSRTRGRPRTKPAELRREELMDAAEQLFLAKSIAATSIDDIVTAAGVAKGTFYLYFQSKEGLLAALQERFILAFCERLDAVLDSHCRDRWRDRLAAWVKSVIEGYLDNVALHDVIFHENQHYDRHAMSNNPVVDRLVKLLSDGAKAGAWITEDPRSTAVMFFHAMHGGVDAAIADSVKINRAKLVRNITAFMERAVSAR